MNPVYVVNFSNINHFIVGNTLTEPNQGTPIFKCAVSRIEPHKDIKARKIDLDCNFTVLQNKLAGLQKVQVKRKPKITLGPLSPPVMENKVSPMSAKIMPSSAKYSRRFSLKPQTPKSGYLPTLIKF